MALGLQIPGEQRIKVVERRLTHMPRNATKLAVDEESGTVILFDSRDERLGVMERDTFSSFDRRGGACTALSADEVQKLPGWDKLKDYANKNWGNYERQIATNEKEYPERAASVCATNEQVELNVNGDPQCTTQSQSAGGDFSGTSGTVALSQSEGTAYTLETTTTKSSDVAVGLKTDISVGIPEIADVTWGTSLTTTVTNSQGTTSSTTNNQQTTSTVTVAQADGQTCKLDFTSQTCTTKGSGNLPFIATGWVWFEYKKKTKNHWLWAVNMDAILDEGDRSVSLSFDSILSTETKSQYNVVCQ